MKSIQNKYNNYLKIIKKVFLLVNYNNLYDTIVRNLIFIGENLKKILLSTVIGMAVSLSSISADDCIMVKDLNVEFKNASTTYMNSAEYQEVKDFANFLKKTDLYAVIEGHTNNKANARYNYDLSTKRAVKVRQEMIKLGVPSSHIRAMGFGESSPLYDNNTEEGLLKNRRVIAEVFNSAQELDDYIKEQKQRIKPIIYKEQ